MRKGYYIDPHFHLESKKFSKDREEVIKRAKVKGLKYLLSPIDFSDDDIELEPVISIAENTEGYYLSFGVHPHNAKLWNSDVEKKLLKLIMNKKNIAIGEIGLDYYYNFSPRDDQISAFKAQIEIAEELKFPIIIHLRDAFDDAAEILFGKRIKGVLHSYTGDPSFLKEGINHGFFVSFSGMITFKKADNIRESLIETPLNRLLLETDSPYLAPVPMRGKRNEPSFVIYTYKKASELLNIEEEKLKIQLEENFEELFL